MLDLCILPINIVMNLYAQNDAVLVLVTISSPCLANQHVWISILQFHGSLSKNTHTEAPYKNLKVLNRQWKIAHYQLPLLSTMSCIRESSRTEVYDGLWRDDCLALIVTLAST